MSVCACASTYILVACRPNRIYFGHKRFTQLVPLCVQCMLGTFPAQLRKNLIENCIFFCLNRHFPSVLLISGIYSFIGWIGFVGVWGYIDVKRRMVPTTLMYTSKRYKIIE